MYIASGNQYMPYIKDPWPLYHGRLTNISIQSIAFAPLYVNAVIMHRQTF